MTRLACRPCGVTFQAPGQCFVCAADGVDVSFDDPILVQSIRDQNSLGYPVGIKELIAAAKAAGPDLTADPCGGGPLR